MALVHREFTRLDIETLLDLNLSAVMVLMQRQKKPARTPKLSRLRRLESGTCSSLAHRIVPDSSFINIYELLEIKPFGLGSRIRDMEAEWRLKVITDLIS